MPTRAQKRAKRRAAEEAAAITKPWHLVFAPLPAPSSSTLPTTSANVIPQPNNSSGSALSAFSLPVVDLAKISGEEYDDLSSVMQDLGPRSLKPSKPREVRYPHMLPRPEMWNIGIDVDHPEPLHASLITMGDNQALLLSPRKLGVDTSLKIDLDADVAITMCDLDALVKACAEEQSKACAYTHTLLHSEGVLAPGEGRMAWLIVPCSSHAQGKYTVKWDFVHRALLTDGIRTIARALPPFMAHVDQILRTKQVYGTTLTKRPGLIDQEMFSACVLTFAARSENGCLEEPEFIGDLGAEVATLTHAMAMAPVRNPALIKLCKVRVCNDKLAPPADQSGLSAIICNRNPRTTLTVSPVCGPSSVAQDLSMKVYLNAITRFPKLPVVLRTVPMQLRRNLAVL
ncbi:hypothetical protein BOTBODRAFT_53294 [Botryobasidium botryosum FD-172 SS1]|uniref:Uncharacterized protein n=1 Tax=Botryobasidium botryosum (strain FD-172 SS1) TaxID=930990 RepID=A0A067N1X3_BOTB1|nr:hypothetical protein BOTBODRAFT_53294 [Botryobasidium botryosum FD-172 SS1]